MRNKKSSGGKRKPAKEKASASKKQSSSKVMKRSSSIPNINKVKNLLEEMTESREELSSVFESRETQSKLNKMQAVPSESDNLRKGAQVKADGDDDVEDPELAVETPIDGHGRRNTEKLDRRDLENGVTGSNTHFQIQKNKTFSQLVNFTNLLSLQNQKSRHCIERIQECKSFGKYLYERKQFEEAQGQFEEALRQFQELHIVQGIISETQNVRSQTNIEDEPLESKDEQSSDNMLTGDVLEVEIDENENYGSIESGEQDAQQAQGLEIIREKRRTFIPRNQTTHIFGNMRKKGSIGPSVSLKEGSNMYEAFLECHINVALCQIRQRLYLHAVITLSTILQYSRKNAQAYYLRGKCYYCLFDYQSAFIDINQVITLHRQSKQRANISLSNNLSSAEQYRTPAWLTDFRDMLQRKIQSDANEAANQAGAASESLHQQNELRRLMVSRQDANSSSHDFIQKMWYAYSPEGQARRERLPKKKLYQMMKVMLSESIQSFDAQFYLAWFVVLYYILVKQKAIHKLLWFLFKWIRQYQMPKRRAIAALN